MSSTSMRSTTVGINRARNYFYWFFFIIFMKEKNIDLVLPISDQSYWSHISCNKKDNRFTQTIKLKVIFPIRFFFKKKMKSREHVEYQNIMNFWWFLFIWLSWWGWDAEANKKSQSIKILLYFIITATSTCIYLHAHTLQLVHA